MARCDKCGEVGAKYRAPSDKNAGLFCYRCVDHVDNCIRSSRVETLDERREMNKRIDEWLSYRPQKY